jgi:predicted DCC family thiol-disulfide oxidoreductase YuxK
METATPILLFDGVCNLCNSWVQLVIKHDKKGRFRFAALQSDAGQELLKKSGLPLSNFTSLVLIEGDKIYQRSSAALRIAKQLSGLWPLAYALIIIPPFIRDGVYNSIAGNRYRWFGRQDSCMMPTPELKQRFL